MLASKNGKELDFLGTLFSYVVSLCIGVFVGYILKRMLKIGAFFMGGFGGIFLALTMNQVIFFWVEGQASVIIFWTLAFILGGYLAYLSIEYYDKIIIMGTAVIGAYSVVRGVSLFFPGTFPNETEIISQISNDTLDPIFYTYVAGFIFTFACGALY
jgi:hypothetical protein